jgi:aspartyl-tRNA synthetase
MEVRKYLLDFCSRNTLSNKINSEGARDFVVPSRMNEGQFYITTIATNLQTIIDGGWNGQIFPNRFRDEDLRADNQNLRKLIAKMAFVEQEDILNVLKVNKTFTERN